MARPKSAKAQDTRQLALDAIARLIQAKGYNGVSMNTLAAEVGVRKASLYHHFPEGKEQLVAEMLERMIKQHATGYQDAIAKSSTVRGRLEHIFRFNLAESAELSHVVVDSVRFLSEAQQGHIGGLFLKSQYQQIRDVLDKGVASGELREHDTALSTWIFLSSMSELGQIEDAQTPDFPERVVTMFVGGIGND